MRACPYCQSPEILGELTCPNCQVPYAMIPERSTPAVGEWLMNYGRNLKNLLCHPFQFFRDFKVEESPVNAVTFALATHWLATLLKFFIQAPFQSPFASLTSSFSTGFFGQFMDNWSEPFSFLTRRDKVFGWIFDSVPLFLDPFFTLFSVGFSSVLLYVGARILISPQKESHPEEINYRTALRVMAYVTGSSVFIMIPWVGRVLYPLASALLLPIAVKEVYRVNWGRAFTVSLFPNLFVLSMLALGLLLSLLVILFVSFFKFSSVF